MTPFQTYCLFVSLRNHFITDSYDYFRYQGKTTVTTQSYEKNKTKYHFEKLAKKYPHESELVDFIVANMIRGNKWVTNLFDAEAQENFHKYIRYNQAVTYTFTQDLNCLLGQFNPTTMFRGSIPDVLRAYMGDEISPQTIIILDHYIDFLPKVEKNMGDFLPEMMMLFRKFRPFVKFDTRKIKPILQEKLLNNSKGEA